MGGFDDIFESIDDITAPPEEEREELTVSEAEAVTGVWNAQDDGNVWSSGQTRPARPSTPAPSRVWNSNDGSKEQSKSPHPTVGPLSSQNEGQGQGPQKSIDPIASDDWEEEDEILEDFTDDDDGGGSGYFDDIF